MTLMEAAMLVAWLAGVLTGMAIGVSPAVCLLFFLKRFTMAPQLERERAYFLAFTLAAIPSILLAWQWPNPISYVMAAVCCLVAFPSGCGWLSLAAKESSSPTLRFLETVRAYASHQETSFARQE